MQTLALPPLVVSIGEPAGIGADTILQAQQAAQTGHIKPLPPFILLADPAHLKNRMKALKLAMPLTVLDSPQQVSLSAEKGLNVLALENHFTGKPGKPDVADGHGVIESITRGVSLIHQGQARALVTLPIHKKSLYDAGFTHPGHTEFLAVLAEQWAEISPPVRPVMMLAGPHLRAVPVTIHIPLMEVGKRLTHQSIVETVLVTHKALQHHFALEKPRLALSGLNPHAGENGAMGTEDEAIITPAIHELQQQGIHCFGPLPADTMFHAAARAQYDVAICMYHDQALIPVKALAFDESVNITLGLPFVRTSPDHGTAFDIAGTGKANPASTIAALHMANQMSSSPKATPL